MILGFNEKFPPKIEAGTKIHTLREDKKDRWKAGKTIHFATGVRTKAFNCFRKGKCVSTQKITITYRVGHSALVNIDYRYLTQDEVNILAKNDGFDSVEDFFTWFDKDFVGKIIHWTDFKY